MPTEQGRAHLIRKMARATSLSELKVIWSNIAVAYQTDDAVKEAKDEHKRRLQP